MEDDEVRRATAERRDQDASGAGDPEEDPGPFPGVNPDLTRAFEPLAPGQEEWARRRIAELYAALEVIRVKMDSATDAEANQLTRSTAQLVNKLHAIGERLRQAGFTVFLPFPSITLAGAALADGLDEPDRPPDDSPTIRPRGPDDAVAEAEPAAGGCLITLDQAAALVNRSPRTLERYKRKGMPRPSVRGGGGRPHEYQLAEMRGWLEKEFDRKIPDSDIQRVRHPKTG